MEIQFVFCQIDNEFLNTLYHIITVVARLQTRESGVRIPIEEVIYLLSDTSRPAVEAHPVSNSMGTGAVPESEEAGS